MSTRQYARSCTNGRRHSIIYKAAGNLRSVQILLGRAKIESMVRYVGVDVEDALELAERSEV